MNSADLNADPDNTVDLVIPPHSFVGLSQLVDGRVVLRLRRLSHGLYARPVVMPVEFEIRGLTEAEVKQADTSERAVFGDAPALLRERIKKEFPPKEEKVVEQPPAPKRGYEFL